MTGLLLIEDDPTLLELIATALEFEGFRVHRAPDGAAGLEIARTVRPALILCDVMMPGMDGYAVLAAVRSDPRIAGVPFIFLTARGEKKDLRLGMTSGADDYLTKPVAIDDLLAAVRGRLARSAATQRAPDFSSHEPLIALGLYWLWKSRSQPTLQPQVPAEAN